MKQIFKTNIGIKTKEVPVPYPDDNEIQVRVYNSLVSVGTEASSVKSKNFSDKIGTLKFRIDKSLNIFREQGFKKVYEKVFNTISTANVESKYESLGYSNAGIVISKGKNVTNINVGDRVACGGNTFAVHGEVAVIPKNLAVKIPENVTFEEAAFTTVGSIAMQGIRRADVKPGEWIIIYGVGLLGLLAVQIAKSWGLRVIALDLNQEKLNLAEELGANKIINPLNVDNILEIINNLTNGYGADASIIYASTSSSEPVNNSFLYCQEKANIVIVGAVGMELVRDVFYRKEQNLIISTSYGPGRYDDEYELKGIDYPIGYVRWTENRNMQEFVSLISEERISVKKLITSSNSVENANEVYKKLAQPLMDEIGVLFNFTTEDETVNNEKLVFNELITINDKAFDEEKINVGIIGAGSYIKSYILPYLQNNTQFSLRGLCNKTPKSSLEVGNSSEFNYITGNYEELLSDQEIDLIFIGTRHNLHAQIAFEALQNGKNVFVEKPLSLDVSGVEKIIKELEKPNAKRLFIGFNRRYAKHIQDIKKKLNKRENPIMINYRINAGRIPADIWVQDPDIGGGRIIGEGCHFIDLCNYIVESDVESFSINSIPINNKQIVADDNYILTINYKDGSIATVFYTSIGGGKQPKELLEVYDGGNSYIVNDFIDFNSYSGKSIATDTLNEQDKGREVQIEEIVKALKNNNSIIPDVIYDINASLIALYAQSRIYGKN